MILDGLCLGGYRSFGTPQFIGPLTKVTLFAGANNTGKSNILKFINDELAKFLSGSAGVINFDGLDKPQTGDPKSVCVGLAAGPQHKLLTELKAKCSDNEDKRALDALFGCQQLTRLKNEPGEILWFVKKPSANGKGLTYDINYDSIQTQVRTVVHTRWKNILHEIRPNHGLQSVGEWIKGVLEEGISPFVAKEIPVALIEAFRRITKGDYSGHSGTGLIPKLSALQHPSYGMQQDKKRFNAIDQFLRDVTENQTAAIEIPDDKTTINVHMNDKVLPLESLGTGIQQVIILAAAATILERHVVCLEEPEIHLHPVFQRKLLRYLNENTSNQYLVATHSSHLLDAPEASIFHVTMDNNQTAVRRIVSSQHRWDAARELGARASDVVQSNCVIWVEGPSDRLYLNHWFKQVDSVLKEGIHYSVLFYGGKVLSHYSADHDPEELDDLVSMLAANRQSAIIIDRDRDDGELPINDTKRRVQKEIEQAKGVCWITDGREIENYLTPEDLKSALDEVHPSLKRPDWSKYRTVLPKDPKKVAIAKAIVKAGNIAWPLDLHNRVVELVQFIRKANHLQPAAIAPVQLYEIPKATRSRKPKIAPPPSPGGAAG